MKNIFIILLLLLSVSLGAQKAERGFKLLEKGEIVKAGEFFDKLLKDDSTQCAAQFGYALFLSHENNPQPDYFLAWDHFVLANKYFTGLTEDDHVFLKEFFTIRDSERRNKTIRVNFDVEEKIIEDKLIKFVREENNLAIAEKFIKVYPNSRFFENVVHIRNHLEYRIAEKSNTLDAYQLFLNKYPEAAQKDEAILARNELAYQLARKSNSIEQLNQFLKDYPEAYHFYDALKLRDQLAFEAAKKLNTIEGFDKFIALYPNSLQIPQAKVIQRKLLYEKARQINTLDAYNEFIARYPDGEFFVDIFNLKTNVLGQNLLTQAQGNTEMVSWIKGFDFGQKNDTAGGISVTGDHKIIISGTRNKEGDQGGTEAWVISVDANGKTLWNKPFGSARENHVKFQILDPSGDILLGGWNGPGVDSISRNGWLFSVSFSGSGKWERNLEGKELNAVYKASTGDYYAGGYERTDSINNALFLMKLNNSFQKMWSHDYVRSGTIRSFALTPAQSVIAGAGRWLWKTDAQGYILWEKLLPVSDSLLSVNLLTGGVLYVSGSRNNSPYLARMNDQGVISWEKNFQEMTGYSINQTMLMPSNHLLVRYQGNGSLGWMVLDAKGDILKDLRFPEAESQVNGGLVVTAEGEIYTVFTKNNFSNTEIVVCKLVEK